MALVTKNDVTQIFAIQAPSIDLPPTFANYPRGWDTARSNNGKPTIKQFNYIQQRTDQNVLWIHQNGAALPYDAAMEYAEGAVVVKDGELQKKQGASWVSATNKGYNLDYFGSGKSYPLHAEIMLENGDIVKSTVANNTNNPNSNMGGWVNTRDASFVVDGDKNQHEINEETVKTLNSVADFNTAHVYLNALYKTKSYYSDGSGVGFSYKYDGAIAKNKHNGGTIIDPSIAFTTITNFLAAKSTNGFGCYVALGINDDIPAELFGLKADAAFLLNDLCVNAALKAAQASANDRAKIVTCGAGDFKTTNTIINTSDFGIIPPKIQGAGREATQFTKTTNSQLGAGYLAPSTTDAVLVSSPRSDNPEGVNAYLISESVKGISLRHSNEAVDSVGWYRHRSAMGFVDDIYSAQSYTHFIFNDCWMTNFGQLWANGGTNGYKFNVATSLKGGNLYATATKRKAFEFNAVLYSDIDCCADGCGIELAAGDTCYDFIDCKGMSGKYNAEGHKGKMFNFSGSYGIEVSGQDWHTAPLTSGAATKITLSFSVVKFIGYDFLATNENLTTPQRQAYEFYSRDKISVIDFDCCTMPQSAWGSAAKKPIKSIVDGSFSSKITDANFTQNGRAIQHVLGLTTSFKELCYVGNSGRVKILSVNATDPSQPYFAYVDNVVNREIGIKVSSISTNSGSPTEIATIYTDDDKNVTFSTKLQAYVAADGWLNVKAASGGYSLDYVFELIV